MELKNPTRILTRKLYKQNDQAEDITLAPEDKAQDLGQISKGCENSNKQTKSKKGTGRKLWKQFKLQA